MDYIPQTLQRRLLKFLLKRTIGHIVQELDIDNLNVQLSEGKIELREIDIKPTNIPGFFLSSGTINYITVLIPWKNLLNENCRIKINGCNLFINQSGMTLEESLINSMYIASDFLQQHDGEDKAVLEEQNEMHEDSAFEGIQMLSSIIERIITNLIITIEDVKLTFHSRHAIEMKISHISYLDESLSSNTITKSLRFKGLEVSKVPLTNDLFMDQKKRILLKTPEEDENILRIMKSNEHLEFDCFFKYICILFTPREFNFLVDFFSSFNGY